MSATRDLARVRRAVATGRADAVLVAVRHAWLSADDDDTRDWEPYRDALARFFPPGRCLQLPASNASEAECVNRVARRLRAHRKGACAEEVAEGRGWYSEARGVAEDLAATFGHPVDVAARVIAVLSPNVTWAQNVHGAHCAFEGWHAGTSWRDWLGSGYGTNREKAWRILGGELGALKGPKVEVFHAAIMGDPNACTVDLWMMRAAGFDHDTPSTRERRVIVAALKRVARECGESVRDLQAVVWVKVRNESTRGA